MNTRLIAVALVIVSLLGAGWWWWRGSQQRSSVTQDSAHEGVAQDSSGRRVLYWYDPMVPQQRFDKPGKSPFMDMQLVPKYADEAGDDAAVRISPDVVQNLGIRMATVQEARITNTITAVGRIEADERRRFALPSRVSGYVEQLYVRAVGERVAKGAKIAEIYSPALLSAQQELIALRRASDLSDAQTLIDAARQRLLLLGMAEQEIESIARAGEAQQRFGLYSPATGYILELNTREGAQIEAGASLLSIADLSSVWLIADVAERAASPLRIGDAVNATLDSAPGKQHSATIDFIYPTLNADTRTVRVRMVLPNPSGELRPGMFAHVTLGSTAREVLTVPSEAVIYTGTRSVVIVNEKGGFRPVEVQTGAEGNARTEILAGLSAGMQVVASGQFLIDSEASLSGILAKLSQSQTQESDNEHEHEHATPGSEASAEPPKDDTR